LPSPVLQIDRKTVEDSIFSTRQKLPTLVYNYCFGHEQSSMLLCPYVTAVALINHSSTIHNAKLVISDRADPDVLQTKPSVLLQKLLPMGIVFEIVASREIAPGEEILIDYGPGWQYAWDMHSSKWKQEYYHDFSPTLVNETFSTHSTCILEDLHPDSNEKQSVPVCMQKIVTDLHIKYVATSKESNHSNLSETACFYYHEQDEVPKSHNKFQQEMRIWPWRSGNSKTATVGGLYPCWLLSQHYGNYTAIVHMERLIATEKPTVHTFLVSNVPSNAIRIVTKDWLHLSAVDHRRKETRSKSPLPLRHYIGIPDDAFPSRWKDLA